VDKEAFTKKTRANMEQGPSQKTEKAIEKEREKERTI